MFPFFKYFVNVLSSKKGKKKREERKILKRSGIRMKRR
jgi:predicted N-acyltransferase